MLEPVGPLSPTTYWIRRVAVIVVAVLVLVGLVWFVLQRNSETPETTAAPAPVTTAPMTGELATPATTAPSDLTSSLFPDATSITSATTGTAASDTGATPSASDPATTSASATEVPATTDPAAQSAAQAAADAAAAQAAAESAAAQSAAQAAADAAAAQAAAQAAADAAAAQAAADAARPRDGEGRLICPDTSMKLTATVGSPTYTVGQQPIVGVTVANVGSEPCVRDVSGSLQEYLAYDAAGTRIWSTADCLPGTGTDVRFLQPGETLQYNIKWSGTTSQPGCAAARTRVPAGEYRIEARIGSLVSSQAALTFQ